MKRFRSNQYFQLGAMLLGVVSVSIVLLAVVLIVIAGFEAAYQYICTVLEYDAKDL